MTRKEITEGLKLLEDNMVYFDELLNDRDKWIDVHELLFETIEALEQQPCEDCISRAEAINAISHAELSFQVESDLNFENYKREVQEIADGILKGQVKAISDLPSIQPKPKTDVLDKIRAEIEQEYNCLSGTRADETLELGECLGLKMSLKIINKYKAERNEDKE